MVVTKSLKNDGNKKINKYFDVGEFASTDGKTIYSDDVKYDTLIADILYKVFEYMNAYKIVVTSGYRTAAHERKVGNASGTGYHVKGMAADINVYKTATERFTSKEIVTALEDLGWNHGIGYITPTAVHVDSRTNKYYFDERYGCKSIKTLKGTDSWYDYFNIKKTSTSPELKKAVDVLVKNKVISSPDYWLDKKHRIDNVNQFNDNVDSLIIKFSKTL